MRLAYQLLNLHHSWLVAFAAFEESYQLAVYLLQQLVLFIPHPYPLLQVAQLPQQELVLALQTIIVFGFVLRGVVGELPAVQRALLRRLDLWNVVA